MKAPSYWRTLRKRRSVRAASALVASVGLLALSVVILLAFLLPLWLRSPQQSVAVYATTESATVTFSGTNRWLVRGAVRCDGFVECPPQGAAASGVGEVPETIEFRSCDEVTVTQLRPDGGILVLLPEDAETAETATLFLDEETFALNGPQAFSGYLEIGEVAASGSNLLQAGDFSFYDRDALALAFDRSPDVVRTGQFRHGDHVTVLAARGREQAARVGAEGDCPAARQFDDRIGDERWAAHVVSGHISLPASADARGFAVTATSPASEVALQVTRFGAEEPIVIRPVWVDIVIASPAFLAVTILLTYLATVMQLFGSLGTEARAEAEGRRKT